MSRKQESSGNQVSLSDILQFLSGSTKIPVCGFDNIPCIHFHLRLNPNLFKVVGSVHI